MILLESRCRGLCVTLTVMQTNRQTHVPEIHSRHCPVGVINKIKGLIYLSVWHVEYRKILCIIVSITSWQKRKHFYISLDTVILTAFITWYHKRTCTGGGELLPVSGSIPLCRPHRHRVKSLGWLVLVIRPASHYTHTLRARGSPRLTQQTCQSHSDVRCDCTVLATDVEPPPSRSGGAGEEELRRQSDNNLSDKCGIKAPLKHTTLLKRGYRMVSNHFSRNYEY